MEMVRLETRSGMGDSHCDIVVFRPFVVELFTSVFIFSILKTVGALCESELCRNPLLSGGIRRFTPLEPINCAGGVKRSSNKREPRAALSVKTPAGSAAARFLKRAHHIRDVIRVYHSREAIKVPTIEADGPLA